jgi:hypothetical protein
MSDNPTGEIPTTIHSGDQLIKQAEDLNQRIQENSDVQFVLSMAQRLQRGTIFNTVYSIILTGVVIVLSVVAFSTWTNSNVVKGILSNCEQDNVDKAADLATWTFIIHVMDLTEEKAEAIMSQRTIADKPVDCGG